LLSAIRKLFFWNYARNTWQWDVLCVVILIFIFLTPKSWFENSERRGSISHQNATSRTLLLTPELVENAGDRSQLEQRVRAFMGRDDIRVVDVRKLVDEQGRSRGYEVDIQ
jgi:hypothetical protein